MFCYMHNSATSECIIFGVPLGLCVTPSTEQNRRIGTHKCKPGGKSKTTHLQTCFDPQTTDGHLSSYTHLSSTFSLSASSCESGVWFFIPPSSSTLPFTLHFIFDQWGWKPKGGRLLTFLPRLCVVCWGSKLQIFCFVYACRRVLHVCPKMEPVFQWTKLRLCCSSCILCTVVSKLLSIKQYRYNNSVTSSILTVL